MGANLAKNTSAKVTGIAIGTAAITMIAYKQAQKIKRRKESAKNSLAQSNQFSRQISEKQLETQQSEKIQKIELVQIDQTIQTQQIVQDEEENELVKEIKVVYTANKTLSADTIVQILQNSLHLIKDKYNAITIKNRNQRRAVFKKNNLDYIDLVEEYNMDIENLFDQAQDKLLDSLKIDKDLFEQSVLVLLEQGFYEQIFILQSSLRQRIKESVPSQKTITLQETKNIIAAQSQILQQQSDFFKPVIEKMKNQPEMQNMIPLMVNTILSDFVFEQFQIEEEDMMRNLQSPSILSDAEMGKLIQDVESSLIALLGQEINMF